jgi:PAS domain S-box-containing protein
MRDFLPPERYIWSVGSSIRVVYVDADHEFAAATATALEDEDDRFTVETVTTASEGLDRIAEKEYDCIISEFDLPGMTGLEFLTTVRETDLDLPFILFTGEGSEDVASTAISASVTDYLQKEAGTEQDGVLATCIGNAVEQARTEREHLEQQAEQLEAVTAQLEQQYEYLFEQAPVMAVATRNENGTPVIEDCNQRFVETLGYEKPAVVGQELAPFYTPESRTALLDEGGYDRALTRDFTREDRQRLAADGEIVETLLRAVPRQDEPGEAQEECDSEHLDVVMQALERMEALIADLLTLAQSGTSTEDTEPAALAEIAETCWQTVETAEATLVTETSQRSRPIGAASRAAGKPDP